MKDMTIKLGGFQVVASSKITKRYCKIAAKFFRVIKNGTRKCDLARSGSQSQRRKKEKREKSSSYSLKELITLLYPNLKREDMQKNDVDLGISYRNLHSFRMRVTSRIYAQ